MVQLWPPNGAIIASNCSVLPSLCVVYTGRRIECIAAADAAEIHPHAGTVSLLLHIHVSLLLPAAGWICLGLGRLALSLKAAGSRGSGGLMRG